MTRTVIPGVQTPKIGIGSGHRRVPNMHQNDVESKILDKISHGGASTVDKSTTGRFPYQQGTFLRGLRVKIRVNRLIRSRSLRKFVRVSVENTRSLKFLANIEVKNRECKKYENYLLVLACTYCANKKGPKIGKKVKKG